MTGRVYPLIWGVALLVLTSGYAFTHTAVASNDLNKRFIYKHSKLKFSLQYSVMLRAQEFSNGVCLWNDAMHAYDRIDICVTNSSLEPDNYTAKRAAKYFKRFRSAQVGEILEGVETRSETYKKIANLKVDGYPAVKVIYDCGHQNTFSSPNAGAPAPRVYAICVYVRKDGEVWEIKSYALFYKETLEKGVVTFEEILRTLNF